MLNPKVKLSVLGSFMELRKVIETVVITWNT